MRNRPGEVGEMASLEESTKRDKAARLVAPCRHSERHRCLQGASEGASTGASKQRSAQHCGDGDSRSWPPVRTTRNRPAPTQFSTDCRDPESILAKIWNPTAPYHPIPVSRGTTRQCRVRSHGILELTLRTASRQQSRRAGGGGWTGHPIGPSLPLLDAAPAGSALSIS